MIVFVYYSDLIIDYLFPLFEDKGMLLNTIYSNCDFDSVSSDYQELPLNL